MFLSLIKFALPVRAVLANEINYKWYHPLKVKVSTLTFQGCLSFFFRTLLLEMFWLARTWFVKYQTLDCQESWKIILIPSIRLR